jgi:hypothetical protein
MATDAAPGRLAVLVMIQRMVVSVLDCVMPTDRRAKE